MLEAGPEPRHPGQRRAVGRGERALAGEGGDLSCEPGLEVLEDLLDPGLPDGDPPLGRRAPGLRLDAVELSDSPDGLLGDMDAAKADVLAYMAFPSQHRTKLHFTNPLERLNKEVKRRADVVGIFPNEDSITRIIGAVLLEANDEWQLQHRYMQIEGMVELVTPQLEEMTTPLPTP
ncbi:hypothetical protein J2Z33_001616 [Rubellimicrobium aerolatum]|nr:hypothetical protein [Rubellimicrobium aerolatum]